MSEGDSTVKQPSPPTPRSARNHNRVTSSGNDQLGEDHPAPSEKETSMKMTIPPQMRGHAGEMFVCAELMRMGLLAAPTARGSRSFDIVALRPDGPVFTSIRVKTGHESFIWNCKKSGELFLDMRDSGDFTVIVDLPDKGAPDYYIIPTPTLEKILQDNHIRWLNTEGKNGHVHQDNAGSLRGSTPTRVNDFKSPFKERYRLPRRIHQVAPDIDTPRAPLANGPPPSNDSVMRVKPALKRRNPVPGRSFVGLTSHSNRRAPAV